MIWPLTIRSTIKINILEAIDINEEWLCTKHLILGTVASSSATVSLIAEFMGDQTDTQFLRHKAIIATNNRCASVRKYALAMSMRGLKYNS